MNTSLITLADVQEFKGISSNINSFKEFTPHVLEAQQFDLKPFMGESFYLALLDDFDASPSLSKYSDLFNGVKYTYNGDQYQHMGLKAILIYHAYARYEALAGSTSTPTGRVHKNNQYSERASTSVVNGVVKQARSGAMAHQDDVKCYLERFSADYPLYKCSGGKRYKSGIIINRIG